MRVVVSFAVALLSTIAVILPARAAVRTVTIWSWAIQSTMEKSIAAFEKGHPDVKVKYTYYNYSPEYITVLKAAAASNSLPDIIGLQPGSLTQQYRNYLTGLNDLAEKQWGPDWANRIYSVNRAQMLMGNPAGDKTYYIIPQESQILCIWYNKTLFAKLGVTPPKTYDELKAVAIRLQRAGYLPMFQGAADGWQNENVFLMLANQFAPGILDRAQAGTVSWTNPALISAMAAWKALFDDQIFERGALGAHAYPTGAQLFSVGRVGMMALGSWWMQESKFSPPLTSYIQNMAGFDFFYLPAVPGAKRASPPIGGIDIGYGLTKGGAKNEAAWDFLASLTNGEALQPALDDLNDLAAFAEHSPQGAVSQHVQDMSSRFMEALPHAFNQRFANPTVADALDNALAGVAAGALTPDQALREVQATAQAAAD
jgi:raffinose/stachyose/melibiose transport system substrate-binding protein